MAKISFDGVEVREFDPLPVGRYPSSCTSANYVAESARSGEPGVAWEFTVSEGEYEGRKGFLNTSLQPQSLWATQRVLMALGMTKEAVDELDWDTDSPEQIQADLDNLLGAECVMTIGHEMYEGAKRQRVRRVLPAEQAEVPF